MNEIPARKYGVNHVIRLVIALMFVGWVLLWKSLGKAKSLCVALPGNVIIMGGM